jgi:thioredoxin reductase (NADPH)
LDGLNVTIEFGQVTSLHVGAPALSVSTDTGAVLEGDVIIVATGASPRRLGVPGEAEHEHQGVSQCASCDGPLYRGRAVVVVGGGDHAVDAASTLEVAGASVTLVHPSAALDTTSVAARRIETSARIRSMPHSEVVEILGDDSVTAVVVRSVIDGSTRTVETSAVFPAVGFEVQKPPFTSELETGTGGGLAVNPDLATSDSGVFAAGAAREGFGAQWASALGDGAAAAAGALEWWRHHGDETTDGG